jgi:hypothetical protein
VPQLDKFIFLPHFLWLCLLLAAGYYGLVAVGLPPLLAVLKLRRYRTGRLQRQMVGAGRALDRQGTALAGRLGRLGRGWTAALAALGRAVSGRQGRLAAGAALAARGRPLPLRGRGRAVPAVRWGPLPGPVGVGAVPACPPVGGAALGLLALRSAGTGASLASAADRLLRP